MPYPFFFSYAHNDNRPDPQDPDATDPHLENFWQELNKRVRYLTGAAQSGFRDRPEIRPGQEWNRELVDALCESDALVCLYSPSYFQSEACGKELQVFLDRRAYYVRRNPGQRPANIIPVMWHWGEVPKTLPDFEYRPKSASRQRGGLWARRDEGGRQDFRRVVQEVAMCVRDARDATPLPPPAIVPLYGAVPSAFAPPPLPLVEFDALAAPGGAECATFVYSAPAWDAWPYAPPPARAVLHVAACIAKGKEYSSCQLSFDVTRTDLAARLNAVRERNSLVVFLVDGTTLQQPAVQQRLREYDRAAGETSAIFVFWPAGARTAAGDALVGATLPNLSARRAPFFYPDIEDHEQFGRVLPDTLDALQMAAVKTLKALPLSAPSPFARLPFLAGPGSLAATA